MAEERGRVWRSGGDVSLYPVGVEIEGSRWQMVLHIVHQNLLGMQPHAGVVACRGDDKKRANGEKKH